MRVGMQTLPAFATGLVLLASTLPALAGGGTMIVPEPMEGEKVRIEIENEGNTTHTFTSDSLSIDQQVAAGKKAKFTITVPSDGTAFEFHCNFHGDMGMKGAFYTKAGAVAK